MPVISTKLKCEWCDNEATISVNWGDCPHTSAICDECFGPDDGMDIMDFSDPMMCVSCEGGW